MTATTTALPGPLAVRPRRYVAFAASTMVAFGLGMGTSLIAFDADASPTASSATARPAAVSASAAPAMSPDATERWAASRVDVYQRKASAEASERQAAQRSGAEQGRLITACRATAHAPDAIERCAGTAR